MPRARSPARWRSARLCPLPRCPRPHRGQGAPTASVAPASYTITINAGTAPAPDIAREVRKAIEDIERERRGRGFGDG
jgi:hypothetical protein